jgi:hypothetical protein
MAHTINNIGNDFHWTPVNLGFSILLGVLATVGIWFFAGLLLMLFLL